MIQIIVQASKVVLILEQQAKKNRTGRVGWNLITKNKRFLSLFADNSLIPGHQQHLKRIKQAFKKSSRLIADTIIDKQGNTVPRYQYDSEKDDFVRRNQFQQIKNEESLIRYIQKSPKGVLVSDELLQYTYKEVQKDLQAAVQSKKLKKINSSNKNKKEFYIFSNSLQREYGLSDSYSFFGQKQYIQLCKENYKYYEDLNEDQTIISNNAMYLPSSQRFNDWVPGYAELKKEWLLKNQQKQKQKQKQ